VVLTLTAVALGLALGLTLPAKRTRFARPRVYKPGLLVAGVAGQSVVARLDGGGAYFLMALALGALVWFAVENLHLVGMGVVAVGLCANIIPVILNQGMPVRAKALLHANVVDAADVSSVELSGGRHIEQTDDKLMVLADIIPLPAAQQVLSFGDLIIFVGTIDVIAHLVRRQRRGAPAHAYRGLALDLREPAMRRARPVQDWGDAPSPVPSSGSQNSDSSEESAPRTVVSATSAPASHSR
jgi:hypothetical protein